MMISMKVLFSLYAKADTILDDIDPESFEFEDFSSVKELVRHTRDVEGSADYFAGNLIYDPDAEFDKATVELSTGIWYHFILSIFLDTSDIFDRQIIDF